MKQNLKRSRMNTQTPNELANKDCCSAIIEEFHCAKRKLNHEPVNDFLKSQWQNSDISTAFLIYRWLFASWFIACMTISLKDLFLNGKWFIYFTNWGYVLSTLMAIYGAVLVSLYHFNPDTLRLPRWTLKLYWCLHLSSFVCATALSFIYWVFIYPFSNYKAPEDIQNPEVLRIYRYFFNGDQDHSCLLYFHNISAHALNSVMMVVDQMLVAFPTRLLHFIYPAMFATIYAIFTLIYYLAGGVNVIGRPYIYKIVNWHENPIFAVLTLIGCVSITFPMCLFAFILYKFRITLHDSKCIRVTNNTMATDASTGAV